LEIAPGYKHSAPTGGQGSSLRAPKGAAAEDRNVGALPLHNLRFTIYVTTDRIR